MLALQPVKYNNALLRCIFAFIASVGIIFYGGRNFDFAKLIVDVYFYSALLSSFLVGILLAYIIHRCTVWLDSHYSWHEHPWERILLQVVVCVISPALLDLILISIYLAFTGQNIFSTGFLHTDFVVVILLLILLNMMYVIQYLWLTSKEKAAQIPADLTATVAKENHIPLTLTIHRAGAHVVLDVAEEILYFIKDSRVVKVVTSNGARYSVTHTLSELEEKYNECGLCRINRSTILNLRTVSGFETGRNLKLIFKTKYQGLLNANDDSFTVKREYQASFKDCFKI